MPIRRLADIESRLTRLDTENAELRVAPREKEGARLKEERIKAATVGDNEKSSRVSPRQEISAAV
jgi:hypothetical protein